LPADAFSEYYNNGTTQGGSETSMALGFGLLIYRIIKGCQTPFATKDFLPLKMCSVDHPKNEVAQRKVIIS